MEITERAFARAEADMADLRRRGHAVSARYEQGSARLIVGLHTGVEIAVPVALLGDLAGAPPEHLSEISVTPSGLGLHWPRLDADVYVPALLEGRFGPEPATTGDLAEAD